MKPIPTSVQLAFRREIPIVDVDVDVHVLISVPGACHWLEIAGVYCVVQVGTSVDSKLTQPS